MKKFSATSEVAFAFALFIGWAIIWNWGDVQPLRVVIKTLADNLTWSLGPIGIPSWILEHTATPLSSTIIALAISLVLWRPLLFCGRFLLIGILRWSYSHRRQL